MKPKKPIVAIILSALVCPGTGHIYFKQTKKGIFFIVSFLIVLYLSIKPIIINIILLLLKLQLFKPNATFN